MRLAILTGFTLIAFAANSLLCRMALGADLIDPVSFTTIRLVSGAVALALLAFVGAATSEASHRQSGSWASALALCLYAFAFSLAYVTLSTGMGALLLFGAVQVTMIAAALRAGERLRAAQWIGAGAALGGLVYLVLPGISAPDPLSALLMAAAGVAWGVYSIRGRGVTSPVTMTTGNFARAAPIALMASVLALSSARVSPVGILLAVVSGSLTSGMGYVLWYSALRGLTTTQASIVQLLVPVLAAFGGVVFLSEQITSRLVAGSLLILGGVAVAVLVRGETAAAPKPDAVAAGPTE